MPSAASQTRVTERLLAALERRLSHGETFTEISVEALTSEAGMSRRTFYLYFGDKVGLIRATAGEVIDAMIVGAQPWWDLAPGSSRSDLEASLERMGAVYEPHCALMRAVAEAATYDPQVADLYRERLGRVAGRVESHIRAEQAAGRVSGEIDPPTMSVWLTGLLSAGLAELFGPAPSPAARREHLTAASAIIWRALHAGSPR
jgi:AcrR family transcriptional regulator